MIRISSFAVRTQAVPGAEMRIEIVREGENSSQGIGFLPDGTMVVVEDGGPSIGKLVTINITNSLQTSAGRMIFAALA